MLTQVHIKKPSLLQQHSLKIATVNQKDFLEEFNNKYISYPFRNVVTGSKDLSKEFVEIALTFPQLTPLLAQNPYLNSEAYDALIATNNPMTLFKLARMGAEGWNTALGEARVLVVLQKYVEFDVHNSDDSRTFSDLPEDLSSVKALWYIFRNLVGKENEGTLESMAQNRLAPPTLLFAMLERAVDERWSSTFEYVARNFRQRYPDKFIEVLKAQLPNFLDPTYKSPIQDVHKYITDNKLEEVIQADEEIEEE